MAQQIDLEKIEQDARHTFNQDGLNYLFMGMTLILIGIDLVEPKHSSWPVILAFMLLALLLNAVRKRITYPRLGYAQFTLSPRVRCSFIGLGVIALSLLFVMTGGWHGRFQRYIPIIFSGVLAIAVSMNGIRWRDRGISTLILLSSLVVALRFDDWHRATAIQFTTIGLLIILVGFIDLVRFVRTHPLLEGAHEVHDVHTT